MAKKAKWLEEGTQKDLLGVVLNSFENPEDEKLRKKGLNATKELLERIPDGEPTIEEIAAEIVKLVNSIPGRFEALQSVVEDEIDEVVEEEVAVEEDEEVEDGEKSLEDMNKKELKVLARDYDVKIGKKMGKDEIIALIKEAMEPQADDDVDEDVEEEDSDDLNVEDILKQLKTKEIKEVAERMGISVKGKKSKQLIAELADNEDTLEVLEDMGFVEFEEEDEVDLDEMSDKELKAHLKELGYKVKKGATREDMLAILED